MSNNASAVEEDTQCDAILFGATQFEQASYCENDRAEGSRFCGEHGDDTEYQGDDTVQEWLGTK